MPVKPDDRKPMIRKILFPVDFSPSCVAMAAYVKRAAAIFGAEVSILHVYNPASETGLELYTRPPSEVAEDHWKVARSKMEVFLKKELPEKESPRILLEGDAAEEIAKTAKNGEFDLIMMPTHAGRFRRMLLGSTAAKVLNDADCPVLTMQHAAEIAPRSLEHRKWVCAIDLSADSERVLRTARDLALAAGAELSLIHALRSSGAESEAQMRTEEERRARLHFAELQNRVGSIVPLRIAAGPVKQALLDAALQSSADVLVVGRSPHGGALGRMRDLTYALVRDSPYPVVSV
jgi:nucleotide-binding universal stress UspA family protein